MDHTIVHFEIPAKNIEKLKKFYSDVFGWKIEKAQGPEPMEYWMIETVPVDEKMTPLRPGVNGGMYKKDRADQKQVNYFSVESIDQYVAKIKKTGGKIVQPKQEVMGIGYIAVAQDPEGNLFAMLEPKQP
jgi:predicted enzyme related to lactoylglutathione lyase